MTTTAARINNSGTLFISGEFNEVTTSTIRINTTTQYAAQFDEVTYNSTNPAIKNLLAYTESFDTGSWTTSSISITQSITTSPNGTLTATKFTDTATTAGHFALLDSSLIAGTRYVQSVFVKSAERTFFHLSPSTGFTTNDNWVNFDLTAGTYSIQGTNSLGATAGIIDAGNGWWRCWMSMPAFATSGRIAFGPTSSLTTARLGNYTGNGIDGVYVWGAQLEIGSEPTIYQGIAAANTLVAPGFAKRETSDGSLYVTDKFDEVTGMIVTTGLLAYYDAGKAASQPATGATWYDISDNNKNATTSANPPTFNTAGYFTLAAVNEQRYLTTALNPTTWAEPWTIEVWMYTPTGAVWGNGVNRSHHIAKGSTVGTWGIIRNPTDNQVTTWIRGAAEQAATPVATLARDRWHQFVGTWDGINTVSSYLNGEFVGSATITLTGAPDTGSLLIGGSNSQTISSSPGTYYDGNIAAVMMYNRALPLNEVTNNFEALRDRFGI